MADLSSAGPFGLNGLTATEAARRLEAGEISSERLISDCLERVEARDPIINAWAHIQPELALEQARLLDNTPRLSPLHGIPIGIKDVFDTEDMPTAHGFPPYVGKMWGEESACVSSLRRAGLVIMGKTVTTEFACPKPIGTKNPHDFSRTASVSSSGSGAAVADFMVTLANGTQTGGSVIGPAASNGVYGFKASLNGIDRAGFRHCKGGIDTIGLFARAMEDLILLRSVNVGEDPGEFIDGKSHPRLALVRTAAWDQAESCSRQAIAIAVDMLKDAGADVNDLELPELFSQITSDFAVVNAWEGAYALQFEVQNHFSEFNDHNNERVLFARTLTLADYETSRAKLAAARAEMDRLASRYDLFLTPSLPGEAPVGTLQVRHAVFNRLWTQMYMPAVNLPLFEGPNGMPVNLQLIGREHSDSMTLLWAQWVDQRLRERLAGFPMAL
jgi:Asp-tRNA(Asn)/Glu-tRNA(Gln) amidotransferase A subunit family amidase